MLFLKEQKTSDKVNSLLVVKSANNVRVMLDSTEQNVCNVCPMSLPYAAVCIIHVALVLPPGLTPN